MAYIYKRGNTWSYQVNGGIDLTTEKRKTIAKGGFRTKTEAKHAAERIEKEVREGTYVAETNITFGDFVQEWLIHYEKQAKISSVRARRIAAKQLEKEWLYSPLKSITRTMYQNRIDELSEKVSHNYLDSIHSTGSMIFKYALSKNLIKTNPLEHFRMPKKKEVVSEGDEELEVFLEGEELSRFLQVTKEHGLMNDLLIFTTLAYSGLRIGELVALKWSDIDFVENSLRVNKTYYNPTNNKITFQLLTPKTKGSKRIIDMDETVIMMFKQHQKQQKELIMKNRKVYKDQNFIFTGGEGYPMPLKLVMTRLQRLLKKLTIDKHITLHSFRHTHISLLIEAGVDIKAIQQRVGHTDINTTMNIYAHLTRNMKEKASHAFSERMKDLSAKLI